MEQVKPFGDPRLGLSCTYCGGATGTRDHVPSRVLLDEPFPENLPVVESCGTCNAGFSVDEEYLASLVDVVRAGAADPDLVERPKIARILGEKSLLRDRLERARQVSDGVVSFGIESERVRKVLLKLARGHAAFELDERRAADPDRVAWTRLDSLVPEVRERFETPPILSLFPEVGSRAMQRTAVVSATLASVSDPRKTIQQHFLLGPDWMEVQPGRYRYLAAVLDSGALIVRIVLSEFLACEVGWT